MKRKLFLLFLIIIALVPRIYGLSEAPIFPDEITWMVRSKESFLALRTFNWDYIFNYFNSSNAWWNIQNDTQSIAAPLVAITGPLIAYLGKGQSILSRNILPDFVVARIPIAVANSVFVLILYLFAKKISGKKTAILVAILYSLDPISIAYSRLILNDSLLTIFIILGLFFFFYIKNERISILLSSLSLALAFLTKPSGILIIVAWFIYFLLSKNKIEIFKKITLTTILAVIFIQLFWPESWYHPVISIFEYLYRQAGLVSQGTVMYFMGDISRNIPFYYYIYQIFSRMPFYITIGLIFYLTFIIKFIIKNGVSKKILYKYRIELSLFIFLLVFFVVVSFSAKKSGVRYVLPLWPLFYISSCWAIVEFFKLLKNRMIVKKTILMIIFVFGLYNVISYYPNYDYYYSKLIGGPKNAQKHVLVGLCYGAKESVEYIKMCFPEVSSFAYIGCSRTVVPYYYSGRVTNDWEREDIVVVEESYRILGPDTEEVNHFKNVMPKIIIEENGATLSRLYLNNQNLRDMCNHYESIL